MGRKKSIDEEQILRAAEIVVARDGAANLTLEAVGAEAGISKASVVYGYKTKHALITAVIERAVQNDNAFNELAAAPLDAARSAVIRGRIAAAGADIPDQFRAVALNLCAALAQDAQLRSVIQANQAAVIDKVMASSTNPAGARLAYLALEGLKLLEWLDYYRWSPEERSQILRDIDWLVDAQPGAAK